MSKPCEYCGRDLPLGVDKKTRQQRSHHFATCKARPIPEVELFAQRTWVGLTDEEIDYLCELAYEGDEELILTVQAKLKEKNT